MFAFSMILWLSASLLLIFARLPNNKGGKWDKEINKHVMEKSAEIIARLVAKADEEKEASDDEREDSEDES